MSIVGFDVGDSKSVISVARKGGIDVILNEASNRFTPVMVGFTSKQRALGEAAKTQMLSNSKNTVCDLIRLIGRSWHDQDLHQVDFKYLPNDFLEKDGQVAIRVEYAGETHIFSAIQVMAMHLAHLKNIAQHALKSPVVDCVVCIPPFFDDFQRRAMLDAGKIAGLNIVRLIHDTTAATLSQGFYRRDIAPDKPVNIALVDFGHSSFTTTIVQLSPTGMQVKATACDMNLGGRDIDELLARHFALLFQQKHKIDIYSRQKALLRLRAACERLKRILSANSEAVLNVESIMEDIDVSATMKRSQLEELLAPFIEKLTPIFDLAMRRSGLSVENIHEVKMIGGCTRIPAVQRCMAAFFKRDADMTINQDEAPAIGCALLCAMLSPTMRVKEYAIQDVLPYSIAMQWASENQQQQQQHVSQVDVFAGGSPFPSSKNITLSRAHPFECRLIYADKLMQTRGHPMVIATCLVEHLDAPGKVKVKVRVDHQGIVVIDSATTISLLSASQQQAVAAAAAEAGDATAASAGGMDEEEGEGEGTEISAMTDEHRRKHKETTTDKSPKAAVKVDLPIKVKMPLSMDGKMIQQWADMELNMEASDRLLWETLDRRNALEEYVYLMRAKVDDHCDSECAKYADKAEKEKITQALNGVEAQLEAEEREASKSAYVDQLNALKKLCDPMLDRYHEAVELRPAAIQALHEAIESFKATVASPDYAYLDRKDYDRVLSECQKTQQWLDKMVAEQAALSPTKPPVLRASLLQQHLQTLKIACNAIFSKPKPKAAEEKKETVPSPQAAASPRECTTESVEIEETGSDIQEQELPVEKIPQMAMDME